MPSDNTLIGSDLKYAISHPTNSGNYVLTGYREPARGLARFDLTLQVTDEHQDILTGADWQTTYKTLHEHFKHTAVEGMMRDVLIRGTDKPLAAMSDQEVEVAAAKTLRDWDEIGLSLYMIAERLVIEGDIEGDDDEAGEA